MEPNEPIKSNETNETTEPNEPNAPPLLFTRFQNGIILCKRVVIVTKPRAIFLSPGVR